MPPASLPPSLPRAPIPSPGPGAPSDNDTQHLPCAHAVPAPAWSPLYALISVFKVTPRQRHCCAPRSRCSHRSAERGDRSPRATQLRAPRLDLSPTPVRDHLTPSHQAAPPSGGLSRGAERRTSLSPHSVKGTLRGVDRPRVSPRVNEGPHELSFSVSQADREGAPVRQSSAKDRP